MMAALTKWPARGGIRILAAVLAIYALQLEFHLLPGPVGELVVKWAPLMIFPAAALLCAANGLGRGRERNAWLLFGLGLLLWGLGIAYFTIFQWDLSVVPTPSPADGFWLAVYPPWYIGLFMLFRARVGAIDWRLTMDGLIGALGMAAIAAAIVFDAVLNSAEGPAASVATNLAYPLGDLVLLSSVVGLIIVGGRRLLGTFGPMAAGLGVFAVADSIYLYQSSVGGYTPGTVLEAGWATSAVLIAAAASRPIVAGRRREDRPPSIAGPLGFGLAGLVLLIVDHFERTNPLALGLASLCVLAVLARLAVTFRDNVRMLSTSRREATTDALTGLGNRRALLHELGRKLSCPDDVPPTMLVLFDLNGFKEYNDTFGHPAGDALLARLGARLADATGDDGIAYRMGGDEFCVLCPADDAGHDDRISTTTTALAEWGKGFAIDCAYGTAILPQEATTVEEALHIADQRMYINKRSGRVSAGRQVTDALLRALTEHHPDLGNHMARVTQLAVAVTQELGLDSTAVERIRLVAQLHDIGKIAIPDEILNKPGPLDADEWTFMSRHTVIGARILLAAPALAPLADLVRSTHERIDGLGYPDRLAAEQIPIESRIICACDAFDAMRSERPYSHAVSAVEALEELNRNAGTQFDPRVVVAIAAVLAREQTVDRDAKAPRTSTLAAA
jgi:diguanylate cyclase (GGDEF)-like protein